MTALSLLESANTKDPPDVSPTINVERETNAWNFDLGDTGLSLQIFLKESSVSSSRSLYCRPYVKKICGFSRESSLFFQRVLERLIFKAICFSILLTGLFRGKRYIVADFFPFSLEPRNRSWIGRLFSMVLPVFISLQLSPLNYLIGMLRTSEKIT